MKYKCMQVKRERRAEKRGLEGLDLNEPEEQGDDPRLQARHMHDDIRGSEPRVCLYVRIQDPQSPGRTRTEGALLRRKSQKYIM